MAITIKEERVAFFTKKSIEKIACELCGAKSVTGSDWSQGYSVSEINVSSRAGDMYPEGDFTRTTVLDICPSCFTDKLLPWFVEQGGKPRVYDTEDGPVYGAHV